MPSTPNGLFPLDVSLPDGLDNLADALDAGGLSPDDPWVVVVTY
ncbi:hypothetical protein [Halorhabdus rudnickae]|nr:hypothetical protein [Halorhabdus rudnickae]